MNIFLGCIVCICLGYVLARYTAHCPQFPIAKIGNTTVLPKCDTNSVSPNENLPKVRPSPDMGKAQPEQINSPSDENLSNEQSSDYLFLKEFTYATMDATLETKVELIQKAADSGLISSPVLSNLIAEEFERTLTSMGKDSNITTVERPLRHLIDIQVRVGQMGPLRKVLQDLLQRPQQELQTQRLLKDLYFHLTREEYP